jgi:hypothetical protein
MSPAGSDVWPLRGRWLIYAVCGVLGTIGLLAASLYLPVGLSVLLAPDNQVWAMESGGETRQLAASEARVELLPAIYAGLGGLIIGATGITGVWLTGRRHRLMLRQGGRDPVGVCPAEEP